MRNTEQSVFITRLENEIENQLKEVLEIFQNLPESTLLQPSASRGWSIAQCFQHLNTYSNFYIPRLFHKIEKAPDIDSTLYFKHSWIGRYFITMMDPAKGTKHYRAIKKHQPTEISNPHEVLAEFIQHLETLFKLLKALQKKNLQQIKISTSISAFIKLNAGDVFWFLMIHNKRHLLQAHKNIQAMAL